MKERERCVLDIIHNTLETVKWWKRVMFSENKVSEIKKIKYLK